MHRIIKRITIETVHGKVYISDDIQSMRIEKISPPEMRLFQPIGHEYSESESVHDIQIICRNIIEVPRIFSEYFTKLTETPLSEPQEKHKKEECNNTENIRCRLIEIIEKEDYAGQ